MAPPQLGISRKLNGGNCWKGYLALAIFPLTVVGPFTVR
jgi:hypothetical protein